MPPATPMRKGFLLAIAADPLGDALSGEDVCDGRRTMLLPALPPPLLLPPSIVIENPGRSLKLWREEERRLKFRDAVMKAAAEGARVNECEMSMGLLS